MAEMKGKLAFVLILTAIVLIAHSTATDAEKSREKRSPKPQFQFVGSIFRWVAKAAKDGNQIAKLAHKASTAVGKFVGKNPGTSAAIAGGAAVVGVGVGVSSGGKPGPQPCVVNIRNHLPDLQPVFIRNASPRSLMVPTNGNLSWAHGEISTIACPSSSTAHNYIVASNSVVDTIKCVGGLIFDLNGSQVNISTITCNQKVTGNVEVRPDAQCAATNKAIGFNVIFPTGAEFFDLYYSCFNETSAATLYTRHMLFGSEIAHKCIYRGNDPSFKTAGFTEGVPVSSAYVQTNQKTRLANIFSTSLPNNVAQAEAQSFYSRSYLQQGHLTPDGDELFTTWQWATYFYINVVGMWREINIGNWKKIEMKVRRFANDTGEALQIYSGTFGNLSLCSISNPRFCPDFTLSNGNIPVPKWLWKIVVAPSVNAAIALVVSNNPFESVSPLCGSRQNDYGWNQDGFDNVLYGVVSFCTVQELKNAVTYIPQSSLMPQILHH